ncbi:hypothetical protein AC579_1628 [Pseudocercospora musae]|uniref:Uncharacterized protein n=1 Tax=Pseudocercospora musae TaxID=113226 RepID=A0A139HZN7_9PEZI|nr:hypothetical protein AC579_1628 [Pseudocercospora musae]KXT07900.1 hypothetical protein AC579_1628 [Pseudocercospora musae]KXT07902.1 hypothetical protein AC579_1628 [Pseudocercospora musae]
MHDWTTCAATQPHFATFSISQLCARNTASCELECQSAHCFGFCSSSLITMPGVPPDAVDNVKKLLKGLFKRNKNKKQDKPTETSASTAAPAQSSAAQAQSAPPPTSQAPPAAQASQTPATAGTSAPDTNKQLPPTKDGSADPAASSAAHTTPATAVADVKSSSEGVSPATGTPAASEPVSAIENDTPPAPPPKNDAPEEASKPTETSGIVAVKENIAPAATEAATASAKAAALAEPERKPADTADQAAAAAASCGQEEKVAVNSEPPPPIKASKPAPGMSATSGPLEDFPEGTK